MQFMALFLFIYLEHKIKRILALSLNWKINFKLFNPEMHQNWSMFPQLYLLYGSKFYYDKNRQAVTRNFKFTTDIAVFFGQILIVWQNQFFQQKIYCLPNNLRPYVYIIYHS